MRIWSWLTGAGTKAAEEPSAQEDRPIPLQGDGSFAFQIVGESHYQPQLRYLALGHDPGDGADQLCEAVLVCEDWNPHDSNAVKIDIREYTIGYLSRPQAVEYRKALLAIGCRGRATVCAARIVGGWDRGDRGQGQYGVRLDLVWPVRRRA